MSIHTHSTDLTSLSQGLIYHPRTISINQNNRAHYMIQPSSHPCQYIHTFNYISPSTSHFSRCLKKYTLLYISPQNRTAVRGTAIIHAHTHQPTPYIPNHLHHTYIPHTITTKRFPISHTHTHAQSMSYPINYLHRCKLPIHVNRTQNLSRHLLMPQPSISHAKHILNLHHISHNHLHQ